MKLSIILPYYKTLDLTKKLLNKLKSQITEEVELIIINDGSNGQELSEYADIFIDRKHNGGVTCARNDGIAVARGEYITFIDCDDMVFDNYIKTILDKINNSSFDLCWISWNSPMGNAIVNSTKQLNIAPWGCIYNSKILKQVRFNENYNLNEEPEFWKDIFNLGELKIDFVPEMIYDYVIRDDSLTRLFNEGKMSMLKERRN